jgi:integrase
VVSFGVEDVSRRRERLGSAPWSKSRRSHKIPTPSPTTNTYLTAAEVAALTLVCGRQGDVVSLLVYTGMRFGELTGLNVEDVDLKARRIRVRRSNTQVGGKLLEGNPKSSAGRRSIPIPERLIPILTTRLAGRRPCEPAITSPLGSRLGLENWKRSVKWRQAIIEIGRRCVCTIFGKRMPAWRAGPAPICGCCRKPWATRRSP